MFRTGTAAAGWPKPIQATKVSPTGGPVITSTLEMRCEVMAGAQSHSKNCGSQPPRA